MVKKFLPYLRYLLIINLLPILKKKRIFLTPFLQNNTRRFQAVVSCLIKYHIWQRTAIKPCFDKGDVIKLIKALDASKHMVMIKTFVFFKKRNLLSRHHSGFRPGGSCTYQLLAITNNIFLSFGSSHSLEIRGVFLDYIKSFR